MKKILGLCCVAVAGLCLTGCAKDKATTDTCSGEAACSDKSAETCSKATECCKSKAAGTAAPAANAN
ncbi:MAG: hypothetical protein H7Y88_06950 [Phycisphaerales bacterium]|nr:hypothetical protein [Phycisphaerales bacterium]